MKRFLEFFSDDAGKLSMLRILLALFSGNVSVLWTIFCLKDGKLIEINVGILTLLGMFISGKVVENFKENK